MTGRRKASMLEAVVLGAYREWSEDIYSAAFMDPTPDNVQKFLERDEPLEVKK